MKKNKRIFSPLKRKVLLLLQAGVALGLVNSSYRQIRVIREIGKEWEAIDRRYLQRIIKEFYEDRLIDFKENKDGTQTVVLVEKGKQRALTFNLDILTIPKPEKWDKKWRGVLFDIPENCKAGRNALRGKLRELGFVQWQKSVFIYPYPCRDQIDFVVECFDLRPYVRYATLSEITNEAELLLYFGISP